MTTTYLQTSGKGAVLTAPAAATIGFFDGVHRGHLFLIEQLRREALRHGLLSMVITFDRHPRQVLHADWQPQLLTTLQEKEQLLAQTGIDQLVVLKFDEQMAALSAADFMQQVLKEQLGVSLLLTGYDNHFGHRQPDSLEGFNDYVAYGEAIGMEVVCGQAAHSSKPLPQPRLNTVSHGSTFSSSLVRRLLGEGRVEEAAFCLGRPYQLKGTVVHGEQHGRQMGFPTANLSLDDPQRLIPLSGVYAVRALLNGQTHCGMTNIGLRPTFNGHQLTIETHIFDFTGNLYGQQLGLEFVARLRDEQPYPSPEALARQMELDKARALSILT